jgi:hypothetical protein
MMHVLSIFDRGNQSGAQFTHTWGRVCGDLCWYLQMRSVFLAMLYVSNMTVHEWLCKDAQRMPSFAPQWKLHNETAICATRGMAVLATVTLICSTIFRFSSASVPFNDLNLNYVALAIIFHRMRLKQKQNPLL